MGHFDCHFLWTHSDKECFDDLLFHGFNITSKIEAVIVFLFKFYLIILYISLFASDLSFFVVYIYHAYYIMVSNKKFYCFPLNCLFLLCLKYELKEIKIALTSTNKKMADGQKYFQNSSVLKRKFLSILYLSWFRSPSQSSFENSFTSFKNLVNTLVKIL